MVLYDWVGNRQGEIINAADRKFTFALNRPQTVEFKLDITNPLLSTILTNKGGMLTLYRDNTLVMTCEATNIRLVRSKTDRALSCVFTETMWPRLTGVLIGASPAGVSPSGDKTAVCWSQINTFNGVAAFIGIGGTGLSSGTVTNAGVSGTWGPYYWKPLMEFISELSLTASGFDFWQNPVVPAPAALNNIQTGTFNAAPLRGSSKPNVAFEFGTGTRSNVKSYEYVADTSAMATYFYALPPDYPNNAKLETVVAANASGSAIYGYRQALVPTDITTTSLRQTLVNEHAAVRGAPRQVYMFQPQPGTSSSDGVPRFKVDYDLGDIIKGRVKDFGVTLLDAQVRVYGAAVEPDANGVENVTLELSLETT